MIDYGVHAQHIALRHICQHTICQVAHAHLCLQLQRDYLLPLIHEARSIQIKVAHIIICTYHVGTIHLQCYIPFAVLARYGVGIVFHLHLGIQYLYIHLILGIEHLVCSMHNIDISIRASDSSVELYLLQ